LSRVTLGDVQAFAGSLTGIADCNRGRKLAALKSLLTFGQKLQYLCTNVGTLVEIPAFKNTLAERILSEADVQRMIALEINRRDQLLLRVLYTGGLRVSEICGLKWRDVRSRDNGQMQITVLGKGGKTRFVLLPARVSTSVAEIRQDAPFDAPVFRSRKSGHLDPSQVTRIVRAAARRAGMERRVSPHWLRHAHASHALDRGAPIHLVQTTLARISHRLLAKSRPSWHN
jgi:integrase/recombinase XerD